jgi:hypothetical protein
MYKKIQYDDVVGNIIIYEYNSIINILIILYLHLTMTIRKFISIGKNHKLIIWK